MQVVKAGAHCLCFCPSALPHRLRSHSGQLQVKVWHKEGACAIHPHAWLYPRHTTGQNWLHWKIWQVCSTLFALLTQTSWAINCWKQIESSYCNRVVFITDFLCINSLSRQLLFTTAVYIATRRWQKRLRDELGAVCLMFKLSFPKTSKILNIGLKHDTLSIIIVIHIVFLYNSRKQVEHIAHTLSWQL